MIKVDAMGDACPIPVVKTKNAIKQLGEGGRIEVRVDNEIAVQNLLKLARQRKYKADFEKISDNEYMVNMEIGSQEFKAVQEAAYTAPKPDEIRLKNTVVAVDSDRMGDGDENFSKTLLKSFIYALSSQDVPPARVIFYNTGVRMTTEGSPCLEDLKTMSDAGAKIYSCGACLNNYGLTDKLAVGEVTNMYDIAGFLLDADLVIRP